MKSKLFLVVFFINLLAYAQVQKSFQASLLGSPYELIVVAKDSLEAAMFFNESVEEVKRIEDLISDWKPHTEISLINAHAGQKPIKVSDEVFYLLERAIKISDLTKGSFDISFASIEKIWKFDGRVQNMPKESELIKSIQYINYKNIILNKKEKTVLLKEKGMKIGLGGIGQGYIADKVKEKLKTLNCKSAIVNVSGDVFAWGHNLKGEIWKIAITNPLNKNEVIAYFPLNNSAVQTSGNYEKYVIIDGERYAHIINPKTGMPIKNIASVSVFAQTTELADALSTAVFVMGINDGLALINQLKNIECIIIDTNGKLFYSNKIKNNLKQ